MLEKIFLMSSGLMTGLVVVAAAKNDFMYCKKRPIYHIQSHFLTLMLVVANLANTKLCKGPEK